METLLKDQHQYWEIYPNSDDLTFWKLILVGPEGTPYEGVHDYYIYILVQNQIKVQKMRFDQTTPNKTC